MPDVIIADTSCLIVLSNAGELNLLQKLYDKIIITSEIALEFDGVLPEWIRIKDAADRKYLQLLEMEIDKGEATAISLAMEIENSVLILDDIKARKIAEKLGLKITGTIGVLIRAKQSGMIQALKPLLNKLKLDGFWLSPQLEQLALREVNE